KAHFFTFGPRQVLIANLVPPLGSTNGTYSYRATLATPTYGGKLNPATHSIQSISVRLNPAVTAGSATTTTAGYTSKIAGATMAARAISAASTQITPGSPPSVMVDLSFSSGDTSWTKGEMTVIILVKD